MSYTNKKHFIVNIIFYAIVIIMVYLLFEYVLAWITPFVVAFFVSVAIQPVATKVSENFKVNKRFAACFTAFLFLMVAIGAFCLACYGLYGAFSKLFFSLPSRYANDIEPYLTKLILFIQETAAEIDPAVSATINSYAKDFLADAVSFITSLSVSAISWMSSLIADIPMFMIAVIVTIISTFFISSDYEKIVGFVMRQLPESKREFVTDIKNHGITTVIKYLKSYAIIMLITFAEMYICLTVIGVSNVGVISLIIAVFDIMPILGSGGVLIPWAILSFIQGKIGIGIGLLVTYGIVTVVRQIIEPKIIGNQVGLPSVVTLMAMFVGVRFMGIIGLFGFPITLVILKNLNDSGKIKLFK